MKKLLSAFPGVLITAMAFTTVSCAEKEETNIFTKDKIIDIYIDIDEDDLEDIYVHPQNEENHSANITADGIKIENAGIRTKGNMTLNSVARSDSERYSYRIKFNKYVKGNKLLELDELCLNNGYSDPSYMREYLHYEVLRELGMNVPETVFCNVYINGENAGFYLAVEGLGDSFLNREFGENYKDGNFYKMDEGATLEYKEDENYAYADLKSGNDTALSHFKQFVKSLNDIKDGEKGDIESFLNVDSALKYIASNTVLCNYDSYNRNMHHNYYLYEDENGVFTVVPWDFNMSFGGFNGNNSEVGIDTPYISGSLETLPLIGKLLSIPEYKEKYYGYIKQTMNILDNFESRVSELKKKISSYVENDPTAFYTKEEFERATSKQTESTAIAANGEKGKSFDGASSIINCVSDRLANLEAQFDGSAEKTTQTKDGNGRGFGGGRPSEQNGERPVPPDFNGSDRQPPQQNGERPVPPDSNGGDRQPPQQNGERLVPPYSNGGDRQPPQQNGERRQMPGNGLGRLDEKDNNKSGGDSKIRVHVNGHIISFNTDPYTKNDSTLVGFRAILEALGAEVTWDESLQTATAVKDDTEIVLKTGSDTAYVNGKAVQLAAAPENINGSTMIPVRFIAEQFGMKVDWNENTKLITIVSK